MHAIQFLHKLLSPVIHSSRVKALTEVVEAAALSKRLTLTSLGRAINKPIYERSGIQKVNRLLANEKLMDDYPNIAAAVSKLLIGHKRHPEIIVDWSKYPNSEDAILRSALSIEGRALTLYEERHPVKKTGNREVQKVFLKHLKRILPDTCKPIVVTDAGFHNDWFKEVLKLDWHYVGRVRGMRRCAREGDRRFIWCSDLFKEASKEAVSLGKVILTKKNSFESHLYIVKKGLYGRKVRTKGGEIKKDKDSKNYGRSQREPWLLASSCMGANAAQKVVNIYHRRMTIEEAFRDLKSNRYGLGLENSQTKQEKRRDIFLLIAMLTQLIAWLIGLVGEKQKRHYQFQSNSIKHRRVISLFYLGCQMIKRKIPIQISSIWDEIAAFQEEAAYE
ncbi:MAG: transposase family protein [Gammaproteobacteria bacterium]|nr:transposase family protein [Gammaproteobacteria bacterium]